MSSFNIKHFVRLQKTLDKLKTIQRQTSIKGRRTKENSAEHSWHLLLWFIALVDIFPKVNQPRILVMLLIHDIPELLEGDELSYIKKKVNIEKEREAARKVFSLFPKHLSEKLFNIWTEFEKGETKEAKIAQSIDRLQPILQNINTRGKMWKKHGITLTMLDEHKRPYMVHDSEILELYEYLLKKAAKFIS